MFVPPPAKRHSRVFSVLLVGLLFVTLYGCEYITSALPPSPTPFPTMARLPSVTPVTPSPTMPPPTATPRPEERPQATPVPTPVLEGMVAIDANVRTGPGVDFDVVTSLVAGSNVILVGQRDGWYQVSIPPDGPQGWMSAQVLEIAPAAVTAVPLVSAE